MSDRALTAEDVMAVVAERKIRFVRMWFTDILGQLKAFSINASELADAFEGGMGFDGSSITGFNAIEESDMIAMPDPTTFVELPCSAPRAAADGGDGLRQLLRRPGARVLLLQGLQVD
jgi:glutamine synthetase